MNEIECISCEGAVEVVSKTDDGLLCVHCEPCKTVSWVSRQRWRRPPEQEIESYIIREFKGDTVLLAREILKLRREKNNARS